LLELDGEMVRCQSHGSGGFGGESLADPSGASLEEWCESGGIVDATVSGSGSIEVPLRGMGVK
jgi:hypothetical protein